MQKLHVAGLTYLQSPSFYPAPRKFFKLIMESDVRSQENVSASGGWSCSGLPSSRVIWKEQEFMNRKPSA